MQKFRIQRRGSIICEDMSGDFCGHGRNTIDYKATATVTQLDAQGFVIDNAKIHEFAKTVIRNNNVSCEKQARLIGVAIHNFIADGADMAPPRDVLRVVVTVSGARGTKATYTWTPDPEEI